MGLFKKVFGLKENPLDFTGMAESRHYLDDDIGRPYMVKFKHNKCFQCKQPVCEHRQCQNSKCNVYERCDTCG